MEGIEMRWDNHKEVGKTSVKFNELLRKCKTSVVKLRKDDMDAVGRAIFDHNKALRFATNGEELRNAYLQRTKLLEMLALNDLTPNIELIKQYNTKDHSDHDEVAKEIIRLENSCRNINKLIRKKTQAKSNKSNPFKYDSRTCLQLSTAPHPNAPWISSALKIETSKAGQLLVATQDLKIGDIVTVEQPLTFVDYFVGYQMVCYACFSYGSQNMVPCSGCIEGRRVIISRLTSYHKSFSPNSYVLH